MSSDQAGIEKFLSYLRRSGLIESTQLDKLLNEFEEYAKPFGTSLTSLATFLIERRLLTEWQVSKLRQNKYKGFTVDNMVLLDVLENDPSADFRRYLARDNEHKRLLAIRVFPPHHVPEEVRYEIEGEVE